MNHETKKIFSLFQLLESVERMVNTNYTQHYWIRAEMTKLNQYQQQHCYPEFIEKKGEEIIASIRGIIWASTFYSINERFKSVVGENLKDGIKVVVLVKIEFSPKHGLSLNVVDIDPTFTLGELMVQKRQVLEQLRQENRINKNKQLPAPILPRRLAIISVNSSKGYQDFTNILAGFSERYLPMCVLFTAILQGDKAVGSILSALNDIKKNYHLFDFVIILRGGGSDIGLTCYNNYQLAAAIADFPLPILTGIGHSTNETIVETVAWKNLITPTDTAYLIIDFFKNFEKTLFQLSETISQQALNMIDEQDAKIRQLANLLKWHSEKHISQHRKNIFSIQNQLHYHTERIFSNQKNNLTHFTKQLKSLSEFALQKNKHQLELNILKIDMLNPKKMLQKGYSITRKNGKVVTSITSIKSGDVFVTELSDGCFETIAK